MQTRACERLTQECEFVVFNFVLAQTDAPVLQSAGCSM
jgi:hypothetical protein